MFGWIWNYLWRVHRHTRKALCFCFAQGFDQRSALLHASTFHPRDHTASSLGGKGAPSSQPSGAPMGGGRDGESFRVRQRIGLLLGPLLFLTILYAPGPIGMPVAGQRCAAVAILMAVWWICESIPVPLTSLLPVLLFPFVEVLDFQQTLAPFFGHLIFLFMGGFVIAVSMQRWLLHRRIAMTIVKAIGFSPGRLVFGFMLATAFLSAFISNTATTMMMMPIGLALVQHMVTEGRNQGLDRMVSLKPGEFAFGLNLMLGIAYAASIGGMATLIGTPPNIVLANYLHTTYGYEMTFFSWLRIGVPVAIVLLPLVWLWLTRVSNPSALKEIPGGAQLIEEELARMGRMGTGERATLIVFVLTALGWVFRKPLSLFVPFSDLINDATIAMTGALLLFLIPTDRKNKEFVMNLHWARKVPWGVLILFGGGLSLAKGIESSGLARWIGDQVYLLNYAPDFLVILCVITLIVFLTEITSNTATSAMAMPLLAAVAIRMGQSPLLFCVPAALSASCAFMLPVATPPNAIVIGSNYITIPQMARSGFGLNLIGIAVIFVLTYVVLIPGFDIVTGEMPWWVSPE